MQDARCEDKREIHKVSINKWIKEIFVGIPIFHTEWIPFQLKCLGNCVDDYERELSRKSKNIGRGVT